MVIGERPNDRDRSNVPAERQSFMIILQQDHRASRDLTRGGSVCAGKQAVALWSFSSVRMFEQSETKLNSQNPAHRFVDCGL